MLNMAVSEVRWIGLRPECACVRQLPPTLSSFQGTRGTQDAQARCVDSWPLVLTLCFQVHILFQPIFVQVPISGIACPAWGARAPKTRTVRDHTSDHRISSNPNQKLLLFGLCSLEHCGWSGRSEADSGEQSRQSHS